MQKDDNVNISYFPGCSLVTTAHENNQSLAESLKKLGVNLVELEDWNCCGSSSAHSIDSDLFYNLTFRILSLAPPDRPLLAPCPSCILRLREAVHHLKHDETLRQKFEDECGKPFNPKLELLNVVEMLDKMYYSGQFKNVPQRLKGLKFVTYYGCTLNRPSFMRREKSNFDIIGKVLSAFGAESIDWPFALKCCGTYLSVVRPEIITPIVNGIAGGAETAGADCIVTPCAMCHLNLEVRCNLNNPVPTLHLSELLALALETDKDKEWFARHLIDPTPVLKSRGLVV